jgi:hypothetical protein
MTRRTADRYLAIYRTFAKVDLDTVSKFNITSMERLSDRHDDKLFKLALDHAASGRVVTKRRLDDWSHKLYGAWKKNRPYFYSKPKGEEGEEPQRTKKESKRELELQTLQHLHGPDDVLHEAGRQASIPA